MDRKSQVDQALKPLRILRLHETIDAKAIADYTDLTPRQAGRVLSIFYQRHYLAKVGTDNHYAQYVRTKAISQKKDTRLRCGNRANQNVPFR